MHEFSICQSLLDLVLEEMERRDIGPGRLRVTRVAAGRMHQIVEDSLTTIYDLLVKDTRAASSRLEIQAIPVRFRCRACGAEQEAQPPRFLCDTCGSGDVDITAGRELYLESLEIDDEREAGG